MKKLIAIAMLMLLPMSNATASSHKGTHHSYANKGWKQHKLTGTKQSRYLHATHRKHK